MSFKVAGLQGFKVAGLQGCRVAGLTLAVCWGMTAAAEKVPSMLPEGRNFKLVWGDEFEGTALNTSKWSYRTNFWGKRAGWFATPEDGAVTVKDGCAHLRIVKRPDGSYCSVQLQTGGALWEPDGYTVFIDGKQSGHKVGKTGDEVVSGTEEFILVSTELKGFRQTGGPVPEVAAACAAGDEFTVDYVRVYDFGE